MPSTTTYKCGHVVVVEVPFSEGRQRLLLIEIQRRNASTGRDSPESRLIEALAEGAAPVRREARHDGLHAFARLVVRT